MPAFDGEANSTLLFDPHVNNFDVVKFNEENQTLLCECCHTHLRVLWCETCRIGYCFGCGFTAHGKHQKQQHDIAMVEPRIVSTTVVGTSLVYHVDLAHQAKHDLRHLVKQLRRCQA